MGIEALAPEGEEVKPDNARFWTRVYEGIASRVGKGDPFPFLNLGFVSPACPQTVSADDPYAWDRLAENLYDRTLTGIDLEGGAVLEVGCGLGGGCAYVAETHDPAEIIGLDLSAGSIEWCSNHHRLPNLSFRQGDALRLPFPADRFDVLLNVESSHCYRSRREFFTEAARVLKPGGAFAFADVLVSHDGSPRELLEEMMHEAGLRIEDCSNLTDGVLESRRLVSRSGAFEDRLARVISDPAGAHGFRKLAFLTGTEWYDRLANGELEYWCLTATA